MKLDQSILFSSIQRLRKYRPLMTECDTFVLNAINENQYSIQHSIHTFWCMAWVLPIATAGFLLLIEDSTYSDGTPSCKSATYLTPLFLQTFWSWPWGQQLLACSQQWQPADYISMLYSVNCYPGGRKIDPIPPISEIQSQLWYHCLQYTTRHHMSLVSFC